jgi:rhomboid family GlyGly-CTERM serine protease
MAPGRRGWLKLSAVLMAGAALAWWLPHNAFDWQPEHAFGQPWRAFTAAWVHWSQQHLLTNLGAALAVAAYGWAADLPRRQVLAWGLAWPFTHLGLLAKPELAHYGGLSGVLHAGVAVVSLWLVVQGKGARRAVGAMVLIGLVIKLVSESPWGPAVLRSAEFDIPVAPIAHASGAIAGLVCAALVLLLSRGKII